MCISNRSYDYSFLILIHRVLLYTKRKETLFEYLTEKTRNGVIVRWGRLRCGGEISPKAFLQAYFPKTLQSIQIPRDNQDQSYISRKKKKKKRERERCFQICTGSIHWDNSKIHQIAGMYSSGSLGSHIYSNIYVTGTVHSTLRETRLKTYEDASEDPVN